VLRRESRLPNRLAPWEARFNHTQLRRPIGRLFAFSPIIGRTRLSTHLPVAPSVRCCPRRGRSVSFSLTAFPAEARTAVKGAPPGRVHRSEAETLDGRRSGGYPPEAFSFDATSRITTPLHTITPENRDDWKIVILVLLFGGRRKKTNPRSYASRSSADDLQEISSLASRAVKPEGDRCRPLVPAAG